MKEITRYNKATDTTETFYEISERETCPYCKFGDIVDGILANKLISCLFTDEFKGVNDFCSVFESKEIEDVKHA